MPGFGMACGRFSAGSPVILKVRTTPTPLKAAPGDRTPALKAAITCSFRSIQRKRLDAAVSETEAKRGTEGAITCQTESSKDCWSKNGPPISDVLVRIRYIYIYLTRRTICVDGMTDTLI